VAFFIGAFPQSACSYPALEVNTISKHHSAEHNFGFGGVHDKPAGAGHGEPGLWQTPPSHFPTGLGGIPGAPAPTLLR
jgi:hypothetical protein